MDNSIIYKEVKLLIEMKKFLALDLKHIVKDCNMLSHNQRVIESIFNISNENYNIEFDILKNEKKVIRKNISNIKKCISSLKLFMKLSFDISHK